MGEKLIRDKIELDSDAIVRQAHPDELNKLLGEKLIEEANELAQALALTTSGITPKEIERQIIDESADVLEVLNTILWRNGITNFQLALRIETKSNARGGFTNRVLVNPKSIP